MRHCIRVIRSVVSTRDESVLQDLVDQGAINQIMGTNRYLVMIEDALHYEGYAVFQEFIGCILHSTQYLLSI
jgi:hypothetical protein